MNCDKHKCLPANKDEPCVWCLLRWTDQQTKKFMEIEAENKKLKEALTAIAANLRDLKTSVVGRKLLALVNKQPNKQEVLALIEELLKENIALAAQAGEG